MAKRHKIESDNWESVFRRLEELVLANSGEDPFEEVFKLLVAKLWNELKSPGQDRFYSHEEAGETRRAVDDLLRMASEQWTGIFAGSPLTALTDEHLAVCVECLSKHALSEATFEAVDAFFEHLITGAAKGSKGQYFTPRHIVDFCVRMLRPLQGELICDPACGSGGFLLHALRHSMSDVESFGPSAKAYSRECLWGFDFDHRAVRVAKALMLFTGGSEDTIFRINSLLTPNSDLFDHPQSASEPFLTIEDVMRTNGKNFRGFDVILTNPPFAGELKEKHFLHSYELHRTGRVLERDILFLERCVQLLRPGGRLAIVLPHNKLGSQSWSFAREWLLQQLQVTGVVGLGRNTFLPHTHQKTSVLFGVKRLKPIQDVETEKIFFAVSERDGKDSKGKYRFRKNLAGRLALWERADHDLDEILAAFRDFQANDEIWRGGYGAHGG